MKKATFLFGWLVFVPFAAAAEPDVKEAPVPGEIPSAAIGCEDAELVSCGSVRTGTLSATGEVDGYGCSGLDYSACGEAVYELCIPAEDEVTINLTYEHAGESNDLDLFLLGSCDAADCLEVSDSTTGQEMIGPLTLAGGTYYVVVDGWNGLCNGSSHTIDIECDTPCASLEVDPESWGQVKKLYR